MRNYVRKCIFITSSSTRDCFEKQPGKFDMTIISTQMKGTLTSSTWKPAAESIFGKIDVKSISKQIKKSSLSSAGQPAPKAKPKHIFWTFDVKVIKKQMKIDLTSSMEYGEKRTRTRKWITEFKEYPTQLSNNKTMLEDNSSGNWST